jgi:hypothetical protein
LSFHWDSKLLPSLTYQYEKEERLTIAVGTSDEMKVLTMGGVLRQSDTKSIILVPPTVKQRKS